jgi:hypothetical protein
MSYSKNPKSGLKKILLQRLEKYPCATDGENKFTELNNAWLKMNFDRENLFLGWNGFMQKSHG